ncbi:hypothetical protein EVG20_g4876, partial [Dentipellis fragilis]
MDNFDPADIPLPAFLDPFLDYLASALPPQLYSILLTVLSHGLAALTAFVSLVTNLISSQPWEWNAQQLLPPLISLLTAYLALLTLYRTTSWMVRTGIWMLKWGAIMSALGAGAGYMMANQQGGVARDGDGGNANRGPGMGGLLVDFISGLAQGQGQARTTPRARSRPTKPRPKAWESFESHREWQFEEAAAAAGDGAPAAEEVQRFLG